MSKTQQQKDNDKGMPDMRYFMPVRDTLLRPTAPGTTPLIEVVNRFDCVCVEIEHNLFKFGANADVIRDFANVRDEFQKIVGGVVYQHNAFVEQGSDNEDIQKLIDIGKKMAKTAEEASARMNANRGQPGAESPPPAPTEETPTPPEGGKVISMIDTRTEAPKTGGKAGTRKSGPSKKKKSKPAVRPKKAPTKKKAKSGKRK